jgi:hypothetical protein
MATDDAARSAVVSSVIPALTQVLRAVERTTPIAAQRPMTVSSPQYPISFFLSPTASTYSLQTYSAPFRTQIFPTLRYLDTATFRTSGTQKQAQPCKINNLS